MSVDVWRDSGDEVANLFNLCLPSGRNQVASDGLCGQQSGPCDANFCLGTGPFAPVEGLDHELNYELIGRNVVLSGGFLDAISLLCGDPEVSCSDCAMC